MSYKCFSCVMAGICFTSTLLFAANEAAAAEANHWTLESVIRRVIEVAPEIRQAEAEVAARVGELTQAQAWPNPTIGLRADNKLGQEDGRGGTDLTEMAISQPLPFRRLARASAAARASLESAQESRRYRRLVLEREAARVFHTLQLVGAKQRLAQERLRLVEEFPGAGRKQKGDPLVRYLTPLDRMRLAVLREEAQQTAITAETEHGKTLAGFKTLLALAPGAVSEPVSLTLSAAPPGLEILAATLDRRHPALAAAKQEAEAARAGIAVAESQRLADPALNVFRQRNVITGERRDATGIGISVQVPLWNTNSGTVAKARAETNRAEAQVAALERDIRNSLQQSHVHLTRLLEQAERYRVHLLEPAREVFDLTRRGFAAGEHNILALIDAYNTYFAARSRYLELLQEGWLAAADLRVAAGLSVLKSEEGQP